MYHPWREARRRPHLVIEHVDLPDDHRGCITGSTVTLNAGDLQSERRCTLTHELVHDERRVYPRDRVLRAKEERTVETIASRRLITLEALADALRWTRHAGEAASELWVDVPMLVTFIQSLTDAERDWLNERLADD